MKIQLVTFILMGLAMSGIAQEKGLTPLSGTNSAHSGSTYAVVVGISDYQDPGIPDLRFADKDAEAFANFLRSPAGGSLDGDHLKLLLNSEATMAQFANALDWLWEVSEEGDNAIIYFSGHGDVEKKSLTQPGFLLCWDAPSRVYMAGGAFALPMLQEVISTLSIQNKAKVVVITDACRSGTLAGQSVGGAQATAANLAKQYANEIKILSCQPNEYSIEGEQWGGGRGAFSYNLVDALYGLADGNSDLSVTLQEVGRYLEDHVTEEVAPVSQVPMVLGNRTERLASVDGKLLADLRSGRTSQMKMLSPIESRGMEDDVLAGVDTTTRELYRLFKKALKDKVLMEPAIACADAYYARLMAEPNMQRLHSTMTRNYAAALQDDAQQVMNTMLKSGLTSEVLSASKASQIYRNYPAYLDRAAELLGSGHYMYAALKARKHYFEGTLQTTRSEKRRQFFQALHWQEDMPHAYAALINQYPAERADSAEYYAAKAMQIAPAWVRPYISLSYFYKWAKQPDKAEELLKRAGLVDSSSILVWYEKARFYNDQKKWDQAEYWYLKTISGVGDEICFPCAYLNLGWQYAETRRYAEAEQQLNKAIQLDSLNSNNFKSFCKPCAYLNLGIVYRDTRRYAEAEEHFKKALQLDSTFASAYGNLGWQYLQTRRYAEAEHQYKKTIQLDSTYVSAINNLGLVYDKTGRYDEAEIMYQRALKSDPNFAPSWVNLGTIYLKKGQLEKVEAAFEKALSIDFPFAHPYAHSGLGKYYLRQGRMDDAQYQFLKSVEKYPEYAEAYIYLAPWAFKIKQIEQAWKYLGQGLEKGYDDHEALQSETDFEDMRKEAKWLELMQKHFPDKMK